MVIILVLENNSRVHQSIKSFNDKLYFQRTEKLKKAVYTSSSAEHEESQHDHEASELTVPRLAWLQCNGTSESASAASASAATGGAAALPIGPSRREAGLRVRTVGHQSTEQQGARGDVVPGGAAREFLRSGGQMGDDSARDRT